MKLIHLTHPHQVNRDEAEPVVMALGYFDGVHLGHQKVIRTAKNIAKEKKLKSAVMTFHPHPSVVLGKATSHVEYITPLQEKARLLAAMDIDILYVVEFSKEFAALLPQQFVDDYIIGLHVKHAVAGFDFTYGRLGKGTMETMPFHSRGEFTQTVVEKVALQEQKISSTLLRSMIREGCMEEIEPVLGRRYTVAGTVVHGDKRGRQIGFPTANVEVNDYILPATGVYAVKLWIHDTWYNGVCNIGYKPTFNDQRKLSVEVHIFDFAAEIYGESVVIEWHRRIRAEQKFNGVTELVAQIQRDKEQAQQYFYDGQGQTCFL
ncbi:bifunctional riboflavin kinase/FAD synthetase [Ectobacillus sp. JY-23]|uniref:bifunctional riboflavin kinase/FAD synthetase n=1 Tax=Ectobacillus sp. JY-23 TaxID=2933872 RepID=UPI001FF43FA3|nr:bifunctional riboflavin kinase/FAD synthetase [Ectobacillus sp. JY-23]UOY93632.1 bifunctional riboflavin kinase/FAD synthetase [Ectobacillus sp. JY-23]